VRAQQIVAMLAVEGWSVDELAALVRRSAPFESLGDASLHAVLDMLSGRYPREDFAELRPRLVWDRAAGTLSARPGAVRLATTSGGTIPDRGLYGVFLAASVSAEDRKSTRLNSNHVKTTYVNLGSEKKNRTKDSGKKQKSVF